jgi:hypothetical protein
LLIQNLETCVYFCPPPPPASERVGSGINHDATTPLNQIWLHSLVTPLPHRTNEAKGLLCKQERQFALPSLWQWTFWLQCILCIINSLNRQACPA